jgi:aryl-alcohol dehydrogenase-like predicted oxidoreductase
MKYRKLGSSDIKVSCIALGCLHFGTYLDTSESINLINWAESQGINFLDTAPLYGNSCSESIIGEAIKGRRDKFILSTKVGLVKTKHENGSFGVKVEGLNEKNIRASLESSLKKLGTDYIDIFQFHAFDDVTAVEESFAVMSDLRREGKIRAVAASNYNPIQLDLVLRVIEEKKFEPLVALETHYNIIERMVEKNLLALCAAKNVSILPYRALARGILTGKYQFGVPYPENSRAKDSWRVSQWLTPETLSLVSMLEEFACNHGKTLTELSLAWLLSKDSVGSIPVGVRNIDQLVGCVSAIKNTLTDNEITLIDKVVESSGQMEVVANLPPVYFEQ